MNRPNPKDVLLGISQGDRRLLSKAITIIESHKLEDTKLAETILLGLKFPEKKSIRIGISGIPGVGKSTFIEAFGMYLISLGKKVAVLAVDPTSPITGGSILGDKTRMNKLAENFSAFIRPSPSSGNLGGVAKKTRDTILLCEAFGFEIILVETVGVGQSEVAVENMTDFFVLLLLANAGDELQGIKKGIMEMADMILINKADGNNFITAMNAKTEFENAMRLFKPKYPFWTAPVIPVSSFENKGLDIIWNQIEKFLNSASEKVQEKREKQNQIWLWASVKNKIEAEIDFLKQNHSEISEIETNFLESRISNFEAVNSILKVFKTFQNNPIENS
jgi:LAO/AO transport system kinase